jgi:hypothetical protein
MQQRRELRSGKHDLHDGGSYSQKPKEDFFRGHPGVSCAQILWNLKDPESHPPMALSSSNAALKGKESHLVVHFETLYARSAETLRAVFGRCACGFRGHR